MDALGWKRYFCAAVTVGRHNLMLSNGFFDNFPDDVREQEIEMTMRVREEVLIEFPNLRKWLT
jgi:hypothetical protein